MKIICQFFLLLLLMQSCSVQKMRYSGGFHFHSDLFGRYKDDKKTIIKNTVARKKIIRTPIDSSSMVELVQTHSTVINDSLIKSEVNRNLLSVKTIPHGDHFTSLKTNCNRQIGSDKKALQQASKINRTKTNRPSLLGCIFGMLAFASVYLIIYFNSIYIIILTILLGLLALWYSYMGRKNINEGNAHDKIFAWLGIVLGSISLFLAMLLLWISTF